MRKATHFILNHDRLPLQEPWRQLLNGSRVEKISGNVISHIDKCLMDSRSRFTMTDHSIDIVYQNLHANLIGVWSRGHWSLAEIAKNITAGCAAAEIVASPLGAWVEVAGKIVHGSAKVSVPGVFLLSYSVT